MTDDIEDVTIEGTEEVTEESPPFLRITSCTPVAGGRVDTLTLELHLRDEDPVGEYDRDRPGERQAAKSWVLDLVATTIRELRRAQAGTFHLDFRDTTMTPDRIQQIVRESETLGHAGSDRWTGGDRKDER
jgi:hypothetical protein